ncbi:hypothetical protein M885DRAFT_542134 [Pelagophyceae sp. CCMP2097]|nr:hypothetical protein M885DRAFT_542134 [Pelagophyceae sp. CCMP2097]
MLQFALFLAARKVKKRKRNSDGGGVVEGTTSLEPATMKLAVNAVKDLWVAQVHTPVVYDGRSYSRGVEDPRTKTVSAYLAAYLESTSLRRAAEYRDPTIGTVADAVGIDAVSISVMILKKDSEVADRTSMRKCTSKVGMQFHSMVRSKDWRKCGVVALAIYFWRRFERNKEPFPDFPKGRQAWYGLEVFSNSQSGADKRSRSPSC